MLLCPAVDNDRTRNGSKLRVQAFSETKSWLLYIEYDDRATKWKGFGFDKEKGSDQSQQGVFQDLEPLARSVLDGLHA